MKTFILLLLSIALLPAQTFANNLVSKIVLYYETDVFILTPEQKNHIENKLDALNVEKIQYFIEIDGHTDNEGNLLYNQNLSDRRANEIKDFFIDKTFVKQQVFTAGHSYKQPLVENIDDDNKQLNRRVEVNIYNSDLNLDKLGAHQLQKETMHIDNQVDNIVQFESGIKFTIAANSFVTSNGEVLEGNVQLHHVPYNDYKDFILSDIPMSSLNENQDYFSSAGMFALTASADKEELQLANDVAIDVEMPATSQEIETELFAFEPTSNRWNKVQAAMSKEIVQQVQYDTVAQGLYQIKRECLGFGFEFYNIRDTVFFDNAMAYLQNVSFTNETVLQEAKEEINLYQLEKVKNKWMKKRAYYNSIPSFKIDTINEEEFKIQFTTRISKNLSASEVKLLNAVKTFITKDQLEKIRTLDVLTNMDIQSIKKDKLLLLFEDENNQTVEFTVNSKTKGSKSRYKKTLKKLEYNFAKVKTDRLNNLQLADEKIEKTIDDISTLRASLTSIQENLNERDIYHKSILDSIYFNLARYTIDHQTKEDFYKDEVVEIDVNKWIVSNSHEKNNIPVQLETVRRALYCSSSFNSTEFMGTYDKVIESKKRKFDNATENLLYTFSMNNLGVMNADRLMKQQNVLAISPKEYVNEEDEVVMVCKIFLVGNSFNGVIRYDGLYGYSPYKFLVDNNKSYGLIAIDVKGNTYKMEKSKFDKTVMKSTEGGSFTLALIDETEDVALFASN